MRIVEIDICGTSIFVDFDFIYKISGIYLSHRGQSCSYYTGFEFNIGTKHVFQNDNNFPIYISFKTIGLNKLYISYFDIDSEENVQKCKELVEKFMLELVEVWAGRSNATKISLTKLM